jgi:hypothetical protein
MDRWRYVDALRTAGESTGGAENRFYLANAKLLTAGLGVDKPSIDPLSEPPCFVKFPDRTAFGLSIRL